MYVTRTRFNYQLFKTEPKHLYKTIFQLYYKDKLVGYRIKLNGVGSSFTNRTYFDIDLELLELVNHDLYGYAVLICDCPKTDLYLDEKTNLLMVSSKCEPYELNNLIEECNYNKFFGNLALKKHIFAKTCEELAKSDLDLKKWYNYYNDMIFNGKLPRDVAVFYDKRMNAYAGMCHHEARKNKIERELYGIYCGFYIRMSVSYVERFKDVEDYRSTLVHEMIHVFAPGDGHGKIFKNKMNEINRLYGDKLGFNVTRFSLGMGNYNFVYKCEKCGNRYEQMRRSKDISRYKCGKCRGELYLSEDKKAGFIYNANGKVIGRTE